MKCELDYFKGCLLGGAVGDALGYAIEFESIEQILSQYGDKGIMELQFDKASGKALISDDTQMTLFTVEGILWTDFRNRNKGICCFAGCTFYSYQRWLYTQTHKLADSNYSWILDNEKVDYKSILMGCEGLYHRRAPGNTCLNALAGAKNQEFGTIISHINNSKGCGGVMRSAPVGLYFWNSPEYAFQYGAESAAITHGHPSGYLSAGTLSAIVAEIITGKELIDAVQVAMNILKTHDRHEECQQ